MLVKIDSTTIDNLGRRLAKMIGFGTRDVRTALQIGPYGVDAHPIKGMIALYAKTTQHGKDVIVGYLNRNAIAALGEHRIFSTDEDGQVKTYVHCKNDGVLELGGNEDFGVRFSKLQEAFNELKADHNDLVSKYNTHTHQGVTTGGGTTGATLATDTASNANIAPAKIDTIKTP
jgi:hypothetical protein